MTTALYTHPLCKQHEMGPYHPESPARIQRIEDLIAATGLDALLDFRVAPAATEADLLRVHTEAALSLVRDQLPRWEGSYEEVDADTAINPYSWDAALHAAGAGIAAVDAAIAGEIRNAFCLVRPIGHHAIPRSGMGFCLFNNVAIAAAHALQVHGLKRVAIVDIDVHHGNGTEDIFLDEPRVMMVSFYQSPFYPYTRQRDPRDHMINVPVPAGTDGEAIQKVVRRKWLPALQAHQPEMIFFSAGFDAHKDDSLGGMALVEEDYAWITQQIMTIADQYAEGRIVSFLEGGYNLSALARSAVAHIRTLAQQDDPTR
jgi:acetoin utilization deacetylase AcuC-like enzyme